MRSYWDLADITNQRVPEDVILVRQSDHARPVHFRVPFHELLIASIRMFVMLDGKLKDLLRDLWFSHCRYLVT